MNHTRKQETGSVIAQGEKLSKELINYLNEHYPLRCRISEVTDKEIRLNIGDDEGVKVGQRF